MKRIALRLLTCGSGMMVWVTWGGVLAAQAEMTTSLSQAAGMTAPKLSGLSSVGSNSESILQSKHSSEDIVLSLDPAAEAMLAEDSGENLIAVRGKSEQSKQPNIELSSSLVPIQTEPVSDITTALPPAETTAAGLRPSALAQSTPTLKFVPQDQIAQLDAPGGQIQPIDPAIPQPPTPEPQPVIPDQTPPAPSLPTEPPVTPPTPPAVPTPALSNTRPSSYVGIGGNFGVLGDTALGNTSLNIYSKIGLTRYLSFRPAAVIDFNNAVTFLLPITVDLRARSTGEFQEVGINSFAPYIGGGVAVNTNGEFGPLLSGGVDIPISRRFTATAGINVGFLDPIDVGVFVGIGYNFSGF
jgi:hypothetical protein